MAVAILIYGAVTGQSKPCPTTKDSVAIPKF